MTVIQIILIVVLVILLISHVMDGIMTRREIREWIKAGTYLNEQDVHSLHVSTTKLTSLIRRVYNVMFITCPVCKSTFYAHPEIPIREES